MAVVAKGVVGLQDTAERRVAEGRRGLADKWWGLNKLVSLRLFIAINSTGEVRPCPRRPEVFWRNTQDTIHRKALPCQEGFQEGLQKLYSNNLH